MKSATYIIFVVLSLSLLSCEKELDFKYNEIDPILVIEASLSQEGAKVSLTETTPMNEPMDRTKVTDAEITITDLENNMDFVLAADATGVFSGDVNGIPGHMYRINVKRNGEEYESRSLMGSPSEIKSLEFNWIKMPYDHVAVLKVAFTDDASKQGDCYWLRIYKNGEAYKWVAITDDLSVNGVIEEVVMTSRKDLSEEDEKTALREGDVVSVTVAPISREMYDYLGAISNDSNGPCLFSGSLCLGYFLAAPLATSSITFEPEKIPYF